MIFNCQFSKAYQLFCNSLNPPPFLLLWVVQRRLFWQASPWVWQRQMLVNTKPATNITVFEPNYFPLLHRSTVPYNQGVKNSLQFGQCTYRHTGVRFGDIYHGWIELFLLIICICYNTNRQCHAAHGHEKRLHPCLFHLHPEQYGAGLLAMMSQENNFLYKNLTCPKDVAPQLLERDLVF